MERSPKSRTEIERLVLEGLRSCPSCEGAAGISVIACDVDFDHDWHDDANWTIAAFNAGTASDYECERELMAIVTRLRGFYELVQKH
jgi:hypothetical protein